MNTLKKLLFYISALMIINDCNAMRVRILRRAAAAVAAGASAYGYHKWRQTSKLTNHEAITKTSKREDASKQNQESHTFKREQPTPTVIQTRIPGTVLIADQATLSERFDKAGLTQFNEKTKIISKLAGQVKAPMGVALAVSFALDDYVGNDAKLAAIMAMRHEKIIDVILEDYPLELQNLKEQLSNEGILKLSDKKN